LRSWKKGKDCPRADSTNRILFGILIVLFGLVLKLVSSGVDLLVFFVALAGLGVGATGMLPERRP
jgi:hypothetical protein